MTARQGTTVSEVLDALRVATTEGAPVALATVVDVRGAAPARVGFKILVRADGTAVGNVGGGVLERRVREDALAALVDGRPRMAQYRLAESGQDALGMLCGGEVTVFVEPYLPKPVLVIVGGGHIGRPLAELARIVGYDVQLVDVRPERGDRWEFDPAAVTSSTYIVLITEDHVTDEAAPARGLEHASPLHRHDRFAAQGRDHPGAPAWRRDRSRDARAGAGPNRTGHGWSRARGDYARHPC